MEGLCDVKTSRCWTPEEKKILWLPILFMIAGSKRKTVLILINPFIVCHYYKVSFHFIVDALGSVKRNFTENSSANWYCETGCLYCGTLTYECTNLWVFHVTSYHYVYFLLFVVSKNPSYGLIASSWCSKCYSIHPASCISLVQVTWLPRHGNISGVLCLCFVIYVQLFSQISLF